MNEIARERSTEIERRRYRSHELVTLDLPGGNYQDEDRVFRKIAPALPPFIPRGVTEKVHLEASRNHITASRTGRAAGADSQREFVQHVLASEIATLSDARNEKS